MDILTAEDYRIELGNRLKEARNNKNITQKQLSEETAIDTKLISGLESGTKVTDQTTLESLCWGLGVTYEELTKGMEMPVSNVRIKQDLGLEKNTVEALKNLTSCLSEKELAAYNDFLCADFLADFIKVLSEKKEYEELVKKMIVNTFSDENSYTEDDVNIYRKMASKAMNDSSDKLRGLINTWLEN